MVGNVIDSRFLRVVDYPTAAVLSVVLMVTLLAGAVFGQATQKGNVYRYLSIFSEVFEYPLLIELSLACRPGVFDQGPINLV
mgnify:CR=1 FL=1